VIQIGRRRPWVSHAWLATISACTEKSDAETSYTWKSKKSMVFLVSWSQGTVHMSQVYHGAMPCCAAGQEGGQHSTGPPTWMSGKRCLIAVATLFAISMCRLVAVTPSCFVRGSRNHEAFGSFHICTRRSAGSHVFQRPTKAAQYSAHRSKSEGFEVSGCVRYSGGAPRENMGSAASSRTSGRNRPKAYLAPNRSVCRNCRRASSVEYHEGSYSPGQNQDTFPPNRNTPGRRAATAAR